jgi:hypothetical protein
MYYSGGWAALVGLASKGPSQWLSVPVVDKLRAPTELNPETVEVLSL